MSQFDRAGRLVRWLPTVPGQLRAIQDALAKSEATLGEVRATVEASTKAQLEALRFLTRSIGELGARLEKLERLEQDAQG